MFKKIIIVYTVHAEIVLVQTVISGAIVKSWVSLNAVSKWQEATISNCSYFRRSLPLYSNLLYPLSLSQLCLRKTSITRQTSRHTQYPWAFTSGYQSITNKRFCVLRTTKGLFRTTKGLFRNLIPFSSWFDYLQSDSNVNMTWQVSKACQVTF